MIESFKQKFGLSRGQIFKIADENKWNFHEIESKCESFNDYPDMDCEKTTKEFECEICYDVFKNKKGYSLNCGHRVCKPCFKQ